MPRYKTLGSVAHNFGHSFTSLMNYIDGDYVMGHLLVRAREISEPSLELDLLTGAATPAALCAGKVAPVIAAYVKWFPELLVQQESSLELIKAARLRVNFDLARERPSDLGARLVSAPYSARVEIEDNRGKVWSADFDGWWTPEPAVPTFKERMRAMRVGLGRLFERDR